jgi:hypothetical protein
LSKRKGVRVIHCAGRPSHVLFPGVTSRFTTTAGLLFSAESSSDFSTRGSDVTIDESTVTSKRAYPFEIVLEVLGEDGG